MQSGARGLARVPSLAGGPALSSALPHPVWDPPALHAERGLEVTLQTPRHPQALSMLQEKSRPLSQLALPQGALPFWSGAGGV